MAEEVDMVETAAPAVAVPEASTADAMASAGAGPMTLKRALQEALKTAMAHDGLCRGVHECVKALDRGNAAFCCLAEDCDEPAYVKLIEALCAARKIVLVKVSEGKLLGEWVGLCKYDKTGAARKVVRCSCAVVKSVGHESTEALVYLNEHLKSAGASLSLDE